MIDGDGRDQEVTDAKPVPGQRRLLNPLVHSFPGRGIGTENRQSRKQPPQLTESRSGTTRKDLNSDGRRKNDFIQVEKPLQFTSQITVSTAEEFNPNRGVWKNQDFRTFL